MWSWWGAGINVYFAKRPANCNTNADTWQHPAPCVHPSNVWPQGLEPLWKERVLRQRTWCVSVKSLMCTYACPVAAYNVKFLTDSSVSSSVRCETVVGAARHLQTPSRSSMTRIVLQAQSSEDRQGTPRPRQSESDVLAIFAMCQT